MYYLSAAGRLRLVIVHVTGENNLLLLDIAATSVEQCETRYKEMLERAKRERGSHRTFQAEFITADCSKVSSVKLKCKGVFMSQISQHVHNLHTCLETLFSFQQNSAPAHHAHETIGLLQGETPDFIPPSLTMAT